jgi:hypothetical protein
MGRVVINEQFKNNRDSPLTSLGGQGDAGDIGMRNVLELKSFS